MDLLTNLIVSVALEVCGLNCAIVDVPTALREVSPPPTLSQIVEQVIVIHCNNEDTPYESL